MSKTLKINVQGIGDETLNEHNFIAKGGEGAIYAKGSIAFKIYEDVKKMIPHGKIRELGELTHPNIVKPELLITDSKNRVIGHTMKFVKDSLPLGQLLTKAFRTRNQITPEMMSDLVKKLHEIILHIHSKNILVVDLNEYNFMVAKKFSELYAIDTNCYQTPHYPATAIMEHIRDRHAKGWNQGTDWFAWAVVTCNMFIGIHPYKGGHPRFDSIPADQRLEKRMVANVSVFNKEARVPAACYPITAIPQNLKNWYTEVFEKGARTAPPTNFDVGVIATVATHQIAGTNLFDIKIMKKYDSEILGVHSYNGNVVVVTQKSIYYNDRKYAIPAHLSHPLKIGFTPKLARPFAALTKNGMVELMDIIDSTPMRITCAGNEIMSCGNRVYVVNETSVFELDFIESSFTMVSAIKVGNVLDLPGATKAFDGVLMQNLLGKMYASIFPEKGKCYQVKIDELDGHRVIDAKYENNILVVACVSNDGKYHRMTLRFAPDFAKYDCRTVKDIQFTGLNFTVADHGTSVCINEEEKVEVVSNAYGRSGVSIFDDSNVVGDMTLYHIGSTVVFAKDDQLFTFAMKKKP